MSESVTVCVDAMGGDNAPLEIVKGAIAAVNENEKVKARIIMNRNTPAAAAREVLPFSTLS